MDRSRSHAARTVVAALALTATALSQVGCDVGTAGAAKAADSGGPGLQKLMKDRNLSEADVTAALKPGKNAVRVSLTNSLRNQMGPHHHKGGEHTAVGPATFRANHYWPNREAGEKEWYDARLGGKAKVWRDDYYMIPFGLLTPPVLVEEAR